MAKVTAPLLSFDASGTVAKTQVYATWRGIKYARKHVIPNNPRSSEQSLTRGTFTYLNGVWKLATTVVQDPWTAFSKGKPFTNRNAFLSKNIGLLRGETTQAPIIFSPGANGGLAVPAATVTAGSGSFSVAMTAPSLPSGWSITKAILAVVKSGNPTTDTDFTTLTAEDDVTPYAPALTSPPAGVYFGQCWFVFTKPDGSTAYSPGFKVTGTVT